MQNTNQSDLAGKNFENLSAKNHESLPSDLQAIQNEKKQHAWDQNQNKNLINGKDYNIDDYNRVVPTKEKINAEIPKEGDLNWNQSRNEPWNVNQNNTQSILSSNTSILQNQSRDVPLNNSKGVELKNKNPEDNKNPTQEETQLKHEFRAPPVAPKQTGECCGPVTHGPAPGSQKQELSGKDIHREEERKNMEGVQFSLQGQKELITKASKKGLNADDKLQGPAWVAGTDNKAAHYETSGKDYKATIQTSDNKTGYEKAQGDVVRENRANQDTAHGQ